MTATFVQQTDSGDVPGANAYIAVQDFKDYQDSRGRSYVGFTDQQIQTAIVRATDYIDTRFTFVGYRRYLTQTTQWPRWDAVDINNRYLRGLPQGVLEATAEYALRALQIAQGELMPDPKVDATGQHVKSKTTKVGPIENHVSYDGEYSMPKYPQADRKLYEWGLVATGGRLVRA